MPAKKTGYVDPPQFSFREIPTVSYPNGSFPSGVHHFRFVDEEIGSHPAECFQSFGRWTEY
jgi:hypothetical protein